MSIDDIFREADAKREQKKQDLERARQLELKSKSEAAAVRSQHAKTIGKTISFAIDYIYAKFQQNLVREGYGINQARSNAFLESGTVSPPHTRGVVYVRKGGVISTLDFERPFKADHEFVMVGNVSNGELIVHQVQNRKAISEVIKTFSPASEFGPSEVEACFREFLKKVAEQDI